MQNVTKYELFSILLNNSQKYTGCLKHVPQTLRGEYGNKSKKLDELFKVVPSLHFRATTTSSPKGPSKFENLALAGI